MTQLDLKALKEDLRKKLMTLRYNHVFEKLTEFAKTQNNQKLIDTLSQIKGQYSRFKKDKSQGTEYYNDLINHESRFYKKLLNVINRLELSATQRKRAIIRYSIIGLSCLLVVLFSSFYTIRHFNSLACPFIGFDTYKIQLFKFYQVYPDGDKIPMENEVYKKINKVIREEQLENIEPKVNNYRFAENELITYEDVYKTTEKCNADLTIWGDYEKPPSKDTTLLNIKYLSSNYYEEGVFCDTTAHTGEKIIKIISVLSAGELTSTVRGIIFWALGIRSFMACELGIALDYFDRMPTKTVDEEVKKYRAMAETIEMMPKRNLEDSSYFFSWAIDYYDKALKVKPEDLPSANNKARLLNLLGKKSEATMIIEETAKNSKGTPYEMIIKQNEVLIKKGIDGLIVRDSLKTAIDTQDYEELLPVDPQVPYTPHRKSIAERYESQARTRNNLTISLKKSKFEFRDLPILLEVYPNNTFSVEDTSGTTIYTSSPFNPAWAIVDNNGSKLTPGTYAYEMKLAPGILVYGNIFLKN